MDKNLKNLLEWRAGYYAEKAITSDVDSSCIDTHLHFVAQCRVAYHLRRSLHCHPDKRSAIRDASMLRRTQRKLAAAEAEVARLRAAAETCLAALERVQPQARGVLVIDDIRKAIAEARAALEPQEATDGNG